MIASFSDHGTKLGDTAINAQVDLSILRGATRIRSPSSLAR